MGFLQETHFRVANLPKFSSRIYPHIYHHGATDSRLKGVSTLIHTSLQWSFLDIWKDEGRVLAVKGNVGGQICTLINIYLPNTVQKTYLEQIFNKLQKFEVGFVMIRRRL